MRSTSAPNGPPPAGGGERAVRPAVTLGFLTGALGGQSRRGPWGAGQVLALAAANAIALSLAAGAWWATSGMDRATSQISWSGVGLLGVVIALASNTWFLARGRQMVRVAQHAVFAQPHLVPFPASSGAPVANGDTKPARPAAAGSGDRYLSVPGTVRYHRPACPLVARKDINEAPRSVHEHSGRRACEVCEP